MRWIWIVVVLGPAWENPTDLMRRGHPVATPIIIGHRLGCGWGLVLIDATPSKVWHQSRPSAAGSLGAQLAIWSAIGLWDSGQGGRAKSKDPKIRGQTPPRPSLCGQAPRVGPLWLAAGA